jgi:hypothetical protein
MYSFPLGKAARATATVSSGIGAIIRSGSDIFYLLEAHRHFSPSIAFFYHNPSYQHSPTVSLAAGIGISGCRFYFIGFIREQFCAKYGERLQL